VEPPRRKDIWCRPTSIPHYIHSPVLCSVPSLPRSLVAHCPQQTVPLSMHPIMTESQKYSCGNTDRHVGRQAGRQHSCERTPVSQLASRGHVFTPQPDLRSIREETSHLVSRQLRVAAAQHATRRPSADRCQGIQLTMESYLPLPLAQQHTH